MIALAWAACLRRHAAVWALIITTLLLITAVWMWRAARHPLRYAGYLRARYRLPRRRRIPRRDPDGEPLNEDEKPAFILIVRGRNKTAPAERSRT